MTTDGAPDANAGAAPVEGETDEDLRKQAARLEGPSEAALALFTHHAVDFGSDAEIQEAATVNAHFKLLMRLLSWESDEGESAGRLAVLPGNRLTIIFHTATDSGQLVWSVPASLTPSKLDGDIKIINDFLLDPVDPQNGKSASELLRKQRKKPVRRKKRIASDAESEGELEFDEDGEPIVKTKTKEKKKRQKKREEEEAAYKSAQFVCPHVYEAHLRPSTHLWFCRFTTLTKKRTPSETPLSSPTKPPYVLDKLAGTIAVRDRSSF